MKNHNVQKFIFFPKNDDINGTMDDIINKYFSGYSYSGVIIDNFLTFY